MHLHLLKNVIGCLFSPSGEIDRAQQNEIDSLETDRSGINESKKYR